MHTLSRTEDIDVTTDAPEAIVLGTHLDLVAALRDAGLSHVRLAGSERALRAALAHIDGAIVVVDARDHLDPWMLDGLHEHPEMFDEAIVVVRGAALSSEERTALEHAHALVWCSERMEPRTLVALARRYRLH